MLDSDTNTLILQACNSRFVRMRKGLKCNIARFKNTLTLNVLEACRDDSIKRVRVINRRTGEWFERVVSDISVHPNFDGNDIYIFSWYHQELTGDQIVAADEEYL